MTKFLKKWEDYIELNEHLAEAWQGRIINDTFETLFEADEWAKIEKMRTPDHIPGMDLNSKNQRNLFRWSWFGNQLCPAGEVLNYYYKNN